MTERPLTKPDHLEPPTRGRWLARNPAGCVALAIGIVGFIAVAVSQPTLWATPDWRLTTPIFTAAVVASIIAVVRRERGYAIWLVGLGCAGATLVLGWVVMFAVVIAATALVILILHAVM